MLQLPLNYLSDSELLQMEYTLTHQPLNYLSDSKIWHLEYMTLIAKRKSNQLQTTPLFLITHNLLLY